jgi:hypothetical protein
MANDGSKTQIALEFAYRHHVQRSLSGVLGARGQLREVHARLLIRRHHRPAIGRTPG